MGVAPPYCSRRADQMLDARSGQGWLSVKQWLCLGWQALAAAASVMAFMTARRWYRARRNLEDAPTERDSERSEPMSERDGNPVEDLVLLSYAACKSGVVGLRHCIH